MKIDVLIEALKRIRDRGGEELKIDVMVEFGNMQVQLPLSDVAYSPKQNLIILMHERDHSEDFE